MATIITGTCGRDIYREVVEHVRDTGLARSPRELVTRDAGFTVIELDSAYDALPLNVGRDLNVNVAAAEAIQLVGAFSEPRLLTAASKNFERFLEDGQLHGAYGRRIGRQVVQVVTRLREDPNTRRAVITLWDPWLDARDGHFDYPCTVMLQFEVRDGRLELNVVMRSNDVWLGLPYDMFQFTQLQLSVANALDREPGGYRHTALSLHLYESDVRSTYRLRDTPEDPVWQPRGFGRRGTPFVDIQLRARVLTDTHKTNEEITEELQLTDSEWWYCERVTSYLGRRVADGSSHGGEAVTV